MKITLTNTLFVFLLTNTLLAAEFRRFEDVCNKSSTKKIRFMAGPIDKKTGKEPEFSYDFDQSFQKAKYIAQGSFGIVKNAAFDIEGIPRIAIKQVSESSFDYREAYILHKLGSSGYSPALYGCTDCTRQVKNPRGYGTVYEKCIYVAQELMFADLDHDSVRLKFPNLKKEVIYSLIKDLFGSLKALWELGYVHNDVKPANTMINEKYTKLRAIDYGIIQKKDAKRQSQDGTPLYRSPSFTLRVGYPVEQKDDMYAAALTVAEMLSGNKDLIFSDFSSNYRKQIPDSCFMTKLSADCRKILFDNAVKILKKKGFGDFCKDAPSRMIDKINLTTLIGIMILYSENTFTYNDVDAIFVRLISDETEKNVPKIQVQKVDQKPSNGMIDPLKGKYDIKNKPNAQFLKYDIAKANQIDMNRSRRFNGQEEDDEDLNPDDLNYRDKKMLMESNVYKEQKNLLNRGAQGLNNGGVVLPNIKQVPEEDEREFYVRQGIVIKNDANAAVNQKIQVGMKREDIYEPNIKNMQKSLKFYRPNDQYDYRNENIKYVPQEGDFKKKNKYNYDDDIGVRDNYKDKANNPVKAFIVPNNQPKVENFNGIPKINANDRINADRNVPRNVEVKDNPQNDAKKYQRGISYDPLRIANQNKVPNPQAYVNPFVEKILNPNPLNGKIDNHAQAQIYANRNQKVTYNFMNDGHGNYPNVQGNQAKYKYLNYPIPGYKRILV